jgi:cytochrome bd-type quinol oxidase subunit 2
MDAVDVHRLQFGFTATFHYLFPQFTMGLALLILILKSIGLRGDEEANRAARFWVKVFGLSFALGVVTGIPLEFQFFPALTIGGLFAAQVLRRGGKPHRAYAASCVALLGALATAAVGIFPNILPARDPTRALPIYDATVSSAGLATALWWWIPGILLVAGYFVFIHTHLPKPPAEHNSKTGIRVTS